MISYNNGLGSLSDWLKISHINLNNNCRDQNKLKMPIVTRILYFAKSIIMIELSINFKYNKQKFYLEVPSMQSP